MSEEKQASEDPFSVELSEEQIEELYHKALEDNAFTDAIHVRSGETSKVSAVSKFLNSYGKKGLVISHLDFEEKRRKQKQGAFPKDPKKDPALTFALPPEQYNPLR